MLSWFPGCGPLLRRMSCQLESVVVETARSPCDDQKAEKQERDSMSPKYTSMIYVLQLGQTHKSFHCFLIIPSDYELIGLIHWWNQSPQTVEIFIVTFASTSGLVKIMYNSIVFTRSGYRICISAFTVLMAVANMWTFVFSCLCSWNPWFSRFSC